MNMVRDMVAEAEFIEDLKMRAEFVKFCRSSGNAGRLAAAVSLLSSLRGMSVDVGCFDADPRTVVCANGVVELGVDASVPVRFRPLDREDWATKSTGVRYIEEAVSDDWEAFLDRFLPDPELRTWAQKVAGYSLMGLNPARVLVIAKGLTSTGKTTFVDSIVGALGAYGGPFSLSLFRDNQDERSRADIVGAMPRRLIFTEETSSAWRLHGDQIKRATGAGTWSARSPFAKMYTERKPAFTPWVVTNNPPTIEGADSALRRRIRVVPFLEKVEFVDEDPFFPERLAVGSCREAILRWVIDGWGLYLSDPSLTDMPAKAAAMTMEVMNEFSELDECLAEICNFEPGGWVSSGDLYTAYTIWHAENGEDRERMGVNKFGRSISQKGYERDIIWNEEDGKTIRVRRGLVLKPDWEKLSFGKGQG
jgi:P4 family phage/plasmid primase-like protien